MWTGDCLLRDGACACKAAHVNLKQGLKYKTLVKLWEQKGSREGYPGGKSYVGNLGNLVHTFSDFDVDIVSSPELREGGDCLVLLLGPVEEVLIAMGKGLLLDLAVEGEVSRRKEDLWALRYLEDGEKAEVLVDKKAAVIYCLNSATFLLQLFTKVRNLFHFS